MSQHRDLFVLTLIFVVIQAVSLSLAFLHDHHDFITNMIGTTICWALYILIELKYKLAISNWLRMGVLLALASDSFLGYGLALYNLSPYYDRLQHIIGDCLLALFTLAFVLQATKVEVPKVIQVIFVFSLGMSIGGLYEVLEFLSDYYLNPRIPNQPDLIDTDLDLISDAVGAALAAFVVAIQKK